MAKMKFYAVPITLEYEADSPEQAVAAAQALIRHVFKTGADANIDCPEQFAVAGKAVLVAEVEG